MSIEEQKKVAMNFFKKTLGGRCKTKNSAQNAIGKQGTEKQVRGLTNIYF